MKLVNGFAGRYTNGTNEEGGLFFDYDVDQVE